MSSVPSDFHRIKRVGRAAWQYRGIHAGIAKSIAASTIGGLCPIRGLVKQVGIHMKAHKHVDGSG